MSSASSEWLIEEYKLAETKNSSIKSHRTEELHLQILSYSTCPGVELAHHKIQTATSVPRKATSVEMRKMMKPVKKLKQNVDWTIAECGMVTVVESETTVTTAVNIGKVRATLGLTLCYSHSHILTTQMVFNQQSNRASINKYITPTGTEYTNAVCHCERSATQQNRWFSKQMT